MAPSGAVIYLLLSAFYATVALCEPKPVICFCIEVMWKGRIGPADGVTCNVFPSRLYVSICAQKRTRHPYMALYVEPVVLSRTVFSFNILYAHVCNAFRVPERACANICVQCFLFLGSILEVLKWNQGTLLPPVTLYQAPYHTVSLFLPSFLYADSFFLTSSEHLF